MAEGTLWLLNEGTGWGLICPDNGGRDLVMRSTDVASWGTEPLDQGAEVNYEVKQGRTGIRAMNVSKRRRYSWRDDSLERLEGKEARHEYYARLSTSTTRV